MTTQKPPLVPWLARRLLFSRSSDGFLSFISWVSVVGVALGVLALSVVLSAINGFEKELSQVITGMYGDVLLYTRGNPVQNPEVIEERIRKVAPEVTYVSPSFLTELMASGPRGNSGAVLEGVDFLSLPNVTRISEHVKEGRFPETKNELLIGETLAKKLGVEVGTNLRLITPRTFDKTQASEMMLGAPHIQEMKVVGLFRMGMHQYDSVFMMATLESVRELLGLADGVTNFRIKIQEGKDSLKTARKLGESFGHPFWARNWAQLNRNLFYAVELEKVVIAIILAAIVIVAAFNVVSTLMMTIHDKTREIAILKAMGLSQWRFFRLFCLIGMLIGLLGTGLGLGIGLSIVWFLEKFDLLRLPPDVYHLSHLPMITRWEELGMVAVFAVVVCFFATLYPAYQVMRQSPLVGLRYE